VTTSEYPVAVVTGGGRGIGAGISKALARNGFHVVIGWTSDEAAAKQTAADIEEAGSTRTVLVRGDVSDQHTSADLATAAVTEFGRLDCWVNNAGYMEAGSILTLTGDQLRRCFEINLLGTFYGIQSAVEAMRSSGGLEPSDSGKGIRGRIINISSEAGIRAWPLYGAYAPSKFAQIGLGQVAALELGGMGITVNTVCPGIIETDMVLSKWGAESAITGSSIDRIRADVTAETLTGALCTPEDVGEAVVWLASPAAKNVTGQSICVNAGVTLH
jgi:NAD(P)-dependent dehydrogenase (short-subunit alcohol dehydrogenase family)